MNDTRWNNPSMFVFLADGFEEVEAFTPIDYARRVGIQVKTVGLEGKQICSARNILVLCDTTVEEVAEQTPDIVFFPGGLKNAETAQKNNLARSITERVYKKDGLVVGICAAPAIVLYHWGIIGDKTFTCYPGMEANLDTKAYSKMRTVVDKNLLTSCAPGSAEECSFELIRIVCGEQKLQQLKEDIVAR
ncbi:MAG: DJ-1/PfpI family protein [Spirochaetaceae bacterium]|nr:DJ-1/PfpI family protein [Spirochaetaceae bacterium]